MKVFQQLFGGFDLIEIGELLYIFYSSDSSNSYSSILIVVFVDCLARDVITICMLNNHSIVEAICSMMHTLHYT